MDWDDLRYFIAVHRAGGLTGAARALGVSIQTVGRRISSLEAAVGATLFVRHPGGYVPTANGRVLLTEAEQVETAVARFDAVAGARGDDVAGIVRVAAPETISAHLLIPALRPLLDAHQSLELDIVTGVASVGIARGEADVALRLVAPERGALTVRRVGTMRHGLYAGQEGPIDPASSRLVGWTGEHDLPAMRWLHRQIGRSPDIRFNHLDAQRAAIAAGLGIGIIPCFLATGLVRIDERFAMEEPLWLVGHAAGGMTGRVRLVYDTIVRILETNADRLRGAPA